MIKKYPFLYLNPRGYQIEFLKRESSSNHRAYLKEAFDHLVGTGPNDRIKDENGADNLIPRIFSLANRLSQKCYEEKDATDIISDFFGDYLASSEALKKINSSIKRLRKEFFSKENPPFPNKPKKAYDWLRSELRSEDSLIRKELERNKEAHHRLFEQVSTNINKLEEISHQSWALKKEVKFICYPVKKTWKKEALWEGTLLAKLKDEIEKFSEKTGFMEDSLILFLLTGIKPVLLLYNIDRKFSVFDGKDISKKFILSIQRPLNKKVFDKIFYKVKEFFGSQSQVFKEKHLDLYELVDSYGGPPSNRKRDFWQKVQIEINKKYPGWFKEERFFNGPRITYNRIMKYLKKEKDIRKKDLE
jgi:hypothetical protein